MPCTSLSMQMPDTDDEILILGIRQTSRFTAKLWISLNSILPERMTLALSFMLPLILSQRWKASWCIRASIPRTVFWWKSRTENLLSLSASRCQLVDTNTTSLVTPRLSNAKDCRAYTQTPTSDSCTPTSCLNGGRCHRTSVGNRQVIVSLKSFMKSCYFSVVSQNQQ